MEEPRDISRKRIPSASRIHKAVYSAAMAVGVLVLIIKVFGFAAVLLLFGVTYSALCTWLTVRLVNRREIWARRTLAGFIITPSLYLLSFGPAWWLRVHVLPVSSRTTMDVIYTPIGILNGWLPFNRAITAYVLLWIDLDDAIKVSTPVNPATPTTDDTPESD